MACTQPAPKKLGLTWVVTEEMLQSVIGGVTELTLSDTRIKMLRYPSTLTKLTINQCRFAAIIPPADDNLESLSIISSELTEQPELPVFARLRTIYIHMYPGQINIPFMPSLRNITMYPSVCMLSELYFIHKRENAIQIQTHGRRVCMHGTSVSEFVPIPVLRIEQMRESVRVIERWWINVALSPPCSGQPAGGVFYRRAMAAFMQARG